MKHTLYFTDPSKKILILSGFYTSYKINNLHFYNSIKKLDYSIMTIEINYGDTCENIIDQINNLIVKNKFEDCIILTISGGGVIGCKYLEKYNNIKALITIDMTTSCVIGYIERNIPKIQDDKVKVISYKKMIENILSNFNIMNNIKIIHHMNYGSISQKELKLKYLKKITPNSNIILYPNNTHHLYITEESSIIKSIIDIFH